MGAAIALVLGAALAVVGGMATHRHTRRRDAQAEMFRLWYDMRRELGDAAVDYLYEYDDEAYLRFYQLSVLAGRRISSMGQRLMELEGNRQHLLMQPGAYSSSGSGQSHLREDVKQKHDLLTSQISQLIEDIQERLGTVLKRWV